MTMGVEQSIALLFCDLRESVHAKVIARTDNYNSDSHKSSEVSSQVKNLCCLLFLSGGTPMFCAGDEFMNAQGGNNNLSNQENETPWLDRSLLQRHQAVFRVV